MAPPLLSSTASGHPAGRCAITAHPSALVFFTGGTDGWVRSLNPLAPGSTRKDLWEADEGRKQIVALAFHAPNALLVGLENDGTDGEARLISADKGELITNIAKTPLGVRDVASSADGKWAAVATNKSGLKVVEASSIEHFYALTDHEGPVKGVCFDPQGRFLASTGADGTLKIWDCRDEFKLVASVDFCKKDDALMKGSDPNHGTRKPCWNPAGTLLAVPGSTRVLVYKRDEWSRDPMHWGENEHTSVVAHVAFSPASLLASASADKMVLHKEDGSKLRVLALLHPLFSLAFSWDGAMAAGVNNDGNLITARVPSSTEEASAEASQEAEQVSNGGAGRAINNDEEGDNVRGESLTAVKAELGMGPDGEMLPLHGNERDADASGGAAGAADIEATSEAIKELESNTNDLRRRLRVLEDVLAEKQDVQSSFQPSSTPWGADDRRYLVWNSVGSITTRRGQGRRYVEIEFAESALRRAVRFQDDLDMDLASLASTGAIYSTAARLKSRRKKAKNREEQDEDGMEDDEDEDAERESNSGSHVYYQVFDRWDESPEIRFHLANESVEAVAVGDEFAALATSRGLLRVLRSSGLQETPVLCPPNVVCMVGNGTMLLVVHRLNEDNLGYMLLDVGTEEERQPGPKTMAQGSMNCTRVSWVGFTDESTGRMPCAMLPDGLLVGLSMAADWRWIPLLDTKMVHKKLKYWPINVWQGGLVAVALPDKVDAYPATMPKPVPSNLELKMPLLGLSLNSDAAKKYEFEAEANLRTVFLEQRQFMSGEEASVDVEDLTKIDFAMLKNFVFCVIAKNSARALGVAKRFRLPRSLEVAINKAEQNSADRTLVEKLLELQRAREQADAEQQMPSEEQARGFASDGEYEPAQEEAPKRSRKREAEEGAEEGYQSHNDDNRDYSNGGGGGGGGDGGVQESPGVKRMRHPAPPKNPFLVQSSPSRKTEESPTRSSKVPKLSRQSSFSVNARLQSKLSFA